MDYLVVRRRVRGGDDYDGDLQSATENPDHVLE